MKKEPKFAVCTPEEVGIPSSAVEAYVQELVNQRIALHSLIVIRHNKIVCEGYWKPMPASFRHRLYSSSKSFTSCAVGLLIEKGLLRLDDKVIKFFPDKAPADPHPWLADMTIRDLLCMTSCFEHGSWYNPSIPDWGANIFTDKVSHVPGSVYSYCTSGTTLLCMIIKRVTGKEFLQVLRPVFDEIGISDDIYCIETPCGYEAGGTGVMATAREFAAFANLCMHYGEHEGKQLLPRDYMIEATSKQVDNSLYHSYVDNGQGYGYQFWCMRHGGFYFSGMGCQFALCLPKEDLVIVTTGYEKLNEKSTVEIFNALWREIYPNLSDEPLPANPEAASSLKALTDSLEMIVPSGEVSSPIIEKVSGVTYEMAENSMNFKWVRFEFDGDEGVMHYENATGVHALPFGMKKQVASPFPETHYNSYHYGTPINRGYDCLLSAAWMMPDSLMIYCQVVDIFLGNLRIAVNFKGDYVTLHTQSHCQFFMEEYSGFASGRRQAEPAPTPLRAL